MFVLDGSLGLILVSFVNLFRNLCKKAGPFCVAKRAFTLVLTSIWLVCQKNLQKNDLDNLGFFVGANLGIFPGIILGLDRPNRGAKCA